MSTPELIKRWRWLPTGILRRAHRSLPANIQNTKFVELDKRFHEFIAHDELGLALEALEEMANFTQSRGGFWRDMERAAQTMELAEKAESYRCRFLQTRPPSE